MSPEEQTTEQETGTEGKSDEISIEDKEKAVEKQLTAISEKVDQGKILSQILADADVQKVISAKRAGQEVEVMQKEEIEALRKGKETLSSEGELNYSADLESLTSTELAGSITKSILEQVSSLIDEKLTPLSDQVGNVGRFVESEVQIKVNTQIEEAKEKYPDFVEQREMMQEIRKTNQGLSIDELYVLAKRRKGETIVTKDQTESERPTHTSARGESRETERIVGTTSQAKFDHAMDVALDKIRSGFPV